LSDITTAEDLSVWLKINLDTRRISDGKQDLPRWRSLREQANGNDAVSLPGVVLAAADYANSEAKP